MEHTDTERLDFLIRNSTTWNPPQEFQGKTVCGYWDDGHPNYGGGGESITPEGFDDPRAALDAAIDAEEAKNSAAEITPDSERVIITDRLTVQEAMDRYLPPFRLPWEK